MPFKINEDLPQEIEVKFKMKLAVKLKDGGKAKTIPMYMRYAHEEAKAETTTGIISIGGNMAGYTFDFTGIEDMKYNCDASEMVRAITDAFEALGFEFGEPKQK